MSDDILDAMRRYLATARICTASAAAWSLKVRRDEAEALLRRLADGGEAVCRPGQLGGMPTLYAATDRLQPSGPDDETANNNGAERVAAPGPELIAARKAIIREANDERDRERWGGYREIESGSRHVPDRPALDPAAAAELAKVHTTSNEGGAS